MKKQIIFLPLLALSMAIPSDPKIVQFITGGDNSVYVIYDAGEGTWQDGETVKAFKVRRGIKWNRRTNRERPSEAPYIEDDDSLGLDAYVYDGKELRDDEASFAITKDMIVTAKYTSIKTTNDPTTESWSVLAKYCDGTRDEMDKNYSTWLSEHGGTYVGAERNLRVNNKDYKVRIIGVDHDSISADGNKKARLTFEFVDVIPNIAYDTNKNVYKGSSIRNFLNVDLLSLIETSARKNIKTVYKVTNIGDGQEGSTEGKLSKTQDKVFPLSLKEMNAAEMIKQTGIKFNDAIENEGDIYEYYGKLTSIPTSLIKHTLNNSTPQAYWTRSPEVSTSKFAWQIETDGRIGKYDEYYPDQAPNIINEDITVSPCFCI